MAPREPTEGRSTSGDGSKAVTSFWRTLRGKVTLGAVLSAVVTAAGFASPEVRRMTCLDLPTAADLEYPALAAGEVPFATLAASLSQIRYDDRDVVFRARYYGEAPRNAYAMYLDPSRMDGRAVLNLRAVDNVASATPFGPDTIELPPFAALVDADTRKALEGIELGSLVEVRGRAHRLTQVDADSMMGQSHAQMAESMRQIGKQAPASPVPDYLSLLVNAASVQRLWPVNDPRSRWTCRLIHGLQPLAQK